MFKDNVVLYATDKKDNQIEIESKLRLSKENIEALYRIDRDGIFDIYEDPQMAGTVEMILNDVLDAVKDILGDREKTSVS